MSMKYIVYRPGQPLSYWVTPNTEHCIRKCSAKIVARVLFFDNDTDRSMMIHYGLRPTALETGRLSCQVRK